MKGLKLYLQMANDPTISEAAAASLINSDLKEIGDATLKLANHVIELGAIGGIITCILQWFACIVAIRLMITNRIGILRVELLVLYMFLAFPDWLFGILRGDVGRWITFLGVLLRLIYGDGIELLREIYFPEYFKDVMLLPGSLMMLIVVAPNFVDGYVKSGWIGVIICSAISFYLLQEHIRASEGFKNAFTKKPSIYNTITILLLFVFPVWALIGLI